jgi:hypothetical protein
MRSEIRLVLWAIAVIIIIVFITTFGVGTLPSAAEMRTRLPRSSYLYFKNIRSADYEIRELDGMTLYLPEERSDTGWFQIVVLWREEEAYIVWETPDSLSHKVGQRPDGNGLWDPDTARMPTHWWIAFRALQVEEDAPYPLNDYFEMVQARPEYFGLTQ